MKTKFFLISLALAAVCMTSCVPKGENVFWALIMRSNDTLLVDYPVTAHDSQGRPIPSSKKVSFETIVVNRDTVFDGGNITKDGMDVSNIEIQVSRLTSHDDVKVLFLTLTLIPLGMLDGGVIVNEHLLDSMMTEHGVIIPVDQDQITIPIAAPSY